MGTICVKDLMGHEPLAVEPAMLLEQALALMIDGKYSCLIVISNCRPIGIVTERDLVSTFSRLFGAGNSANIEVMQISEIMTPDPVCIDGNTSFEDALMLSRSRKLRHLPVIDQQQLVGLVTQTHLLDAYVQLMAQQSRLESNIEELKVLSLEDPLLRIGNRRAMEVDLAYTEAEAKRHDKTFSVALFDIDCFKKYNDCYGHQAGDAALSAVATIIKKTVRNSDRVFRYGGEEILVLMPESDDQASAICAERIRQAVACLNIAHVESDHGVLTVSGGVCSELQADWQAMVAQADRELYRAKRCGRNRVVNALPSLSVSPE